VRKSASIVGAHRTSKEGTVLVGQLNGSMHNAVPARVLLGLRETCTLLTHQQWSHTIPLSLAGCSNAI